MPLPLIIVFSCIGAFVSVTNLILMFLNRAAKSGSGESMVIERISALERRADSGDRVMDKHTESLGSFQSFVARVEEFMRSQIGYNTTASQERHDMNTRLSKSEGREEGRQK